MILDPVLELVALIGGIVWTVLVFLAAKWQDPVFQCKARRLLTKKEWMLIIVRNKDGKSLFMFAMLPDNSTIKQKGSEEIWIAKKDRVYRFDKMEAGFKLNKDDMKFTEGVPCLIIDHDSVKPARFADEVNSDENTGIPPFELGVWNANYIANEIAKDREVFKKLTGIIIAILVLALVGLAVSGFGTAQDIDMKTALAQCINTTINNTMCVAKAQPGFVPAGGVPNVP